MKLNLSIEEAFEIIEPFAATILTEEITLFEAAGRILAQDLVAKVDNPNTDSSAMDGYACHVEDTLSASPENPAILKLIGDCPAGSDFKVNVGKNEAVSVYTGSAMPKDCDAILRLEHCKLEGQWLYCYQVAKKEDIRKQAQHFQKGQLCLSQGSKLNASSIGLAALMGHAKVLVSRQPRIGILTTGNELRAPGEPLEKGMVYNANESTIYHLIKHYGALPVLLGHSEDDPDLVFEQIKNSAGLDMIVITGGVSVGAYDSVRNCLMDKAEVLFWKLQLRPGGPTMFAHFAGLPVLALPGNPVACAVIFHLLGSFWISRSLGSQKISVFEKKQTAIAKTTFRGIDAKLAFWRARVFTDENRLFIEDIGQQGSAILRSLAQANALAITHNHPINCGDTVEFISIEDQIPYKYSAQ